MEIIRHIVSGPSPSMCLVHLGESISESKRSAHLRAVFQSPGTGRRKVAFACDSNELALFLRVLSREIEGESATIPISRNRGFVRVTSLKSGAGQKERNAKPREWPTGLRSAPSSWAV